MSDQAGGHVPYEGYVKLHVPEEVYTTYPEEIQGIVKVLLEHENLISDGYGHYNDMRESLTFIAYEILVAVLDKHT